MKPSPNQHFANLARSQALGTVFHREDSDPLIKVESNRWNYIDNVGASEYGGYGDKQIGTLINVCETEAWSFS